MKKAFFILTAFLLLALAFHAAAQIPRTLSYQGVLTDNAGKPRPDGSYSFTFRFYTSPTSGTAIWFESKSLPVKNGLFSTVLGEQTPFGAAVKFDQQYWLGIQVGNEPELSPRMALTSVGYSFSSLRADTASVSVASLADTTWRHSGVNIYRLNGNVGIGTASASDKLHVAGSLRLSGNHAGSNRVIFADENAVGKEWELYPAANYFHIYNRTDGFSPLTILNGGNVGIGTTSPSEKLHVAGSLRLSGNHAGSNRVIFADENGVGKEWELYPAANYFHIYNRTDDLYPLTISNGGNVSIGIPGSPHKFHVETSDNSYFAALFRNGGGSGPGVMIRAGAAPTGANFPLLWVGDHSGAYCQFYVSGNGNVGIGTTSPTTKLHVEGTTTTKVLAITGGMDLAEPFEISESQPIPKGALVIIDEENPGQLKLSHQAYDKRVAGVVSGAGGINPGLTLTQEGVLEGGQNVALAGRVYALATAANGPIKPGDLLTTSDVAGHAMKAADKEHLDGSIIGKAMSKLENGEGLVLVLVNLQ